MPNNIFISRNDNNRLKPILNPVIHQLLRLTCGVCVLYLVLWPAGLLRCTASDDDAGPSNASTPTVRSAAA